MLEEIQGQGIVFETLTPGQSIIFRNLTPGQGAFSDFPAAPPRMFVDQVPPPGLNQIKQIFIVHNCKVILLRTL